MTTQEIKQGSDQEPVGSLGLDDQGALPAESIDHVMDEPEQEPASTADFGGYGVQVLKMTIRSWKKNRSLMLYPCWIWTEVKSRKTQVSLWWFQTTRSFRRKCLPQELQSIVILLI